MLFLKINSNVNEYRKETCLQVWFCGFSSFSFLSSFIFFSRLSYLMTCWQILKFLNFNHWSCNVIIKQFFCWYSKPQMSAWSISWYLIDLSILEKSMNFQWPETVWFYPVTNKDTSALNPSDKKHICGVEIRDHLHPSWPSVYQPAIVSAIKFFFMNQLLQISCYLVE